MPEDLERLLGLDQDLDPLVQPHVVRDNRQPVRAAIPEKLHGDPGCLAGVELDQIFHVLTMAGSDRGATGR